MNYNFKTEFHSKNKLIYVNEKPLSIINETKGILDEIWYGKEFREIIERKSLKEKQYFIVFDKTNQCDKYYFKGNYGRTIPLRSLGRRTVKNLVPGEYLTTLVRGHSADYDYFIWLSYRLYNIEKSDEQKILLFWILIHELEHLYQFLKFCPEISEVDNFLASVASYGKLDYQSPLEYHADIKAKNFLENKFGQEHIEGFCNTRSEKRFKEMLIIERKKSINIEETLIEVVCKNQKELEIIQNNNHGDSNKFFSVRKICDTGRICQNNLLEI